MGEEFRGERIDFPSEENKEEKSYSQIFEERFPFYLSIGMTEKDYWEGSNSLPFFYLKAFNEKRKEQREDLDYQCWLQGLYFYDALCQVSPVLHAFAASGTKAGPYPDKPYSVQHKEEKKKAEEDKKVENERLKAIQYFRNFAKANKDLGE